MNSNYNKVKSNFAKYKGNDDAILKPSTRKDKKFMVIHDGKITHFGAAGMQDFTGHQDKARQKSYLARAKGIRGEWKKNKYSSNNLAIHILWS
jgi:hypothetical protein